MYETKCNSSGEGGLQIKQPSLVKIWIFSKTTRCMIGHLLYMYVHLFKVSRLGCHKDLCLNLSLSSARLCSNGARSPQATNIWSRATEKEKQSPARAPRFPLVGKPETNPANLLKGNGTKQKETSSCSRAPVSPINKSAESAVQFNSWLALSRNIKINQKPRSG